MSAQKKQKQVDTEPEPGPELAAVPDDELELPPPVEADDKIEMVKLKFRGYEFVLPKLMDEWSTEACLAMNEGNYVLSAKILLGPGQWALLMSLGDKRRDIREFLRVFADVVDEECVA